MSFNFITPSSGYIKIDVIDEYSDALTMNEDGGESTEPEQHEKTLFFGGMQQNNETPGNYTVNAIDVEELRKSQRRTRPSDLAVTNPSQVVQSRILHFNEFLAEVCIFLQIIQNYINRYHDLSQIAQKVA